MSTYWVFKKENTYTHIFVLSQVCCGNTKEFPTIWKKVPHSDELHNIKWNLKEKMYIKYQNILNIARPAGLNYRTC